MIGSDSIRPAISRVKLKPGHAAIRKRPWTNGHVRGFETDQRTAN